jgi:hypothetical protein
MSNHQKFKELRQRHTSSGKSKNTRAMSSGKKTLTTESPPSKTKSQFIEEKIQQMEKDLKSKGYKDF